MSVTAIELKTTVTAIAAASTIFPNWLAATKVFPASWAVEMTKFPTAIAERQKACEIRHTEDVP
jgi:hypothetical protein